MTLQDISIPSAAQAKPAAQARAKTASRLGYIDMTRVILSILVIMVHAAVTYGSIGGWTYVDPRQDELTSIILSFFVIYSQSFFMGLFFFFTGYFTPASYDRKGWLGFWKDRILRLAIPMLAYTFIFCKIPNYIDETAHAGLRMTFPQYFMANFWTELDEGPTWFILVTLLFSAAYTLWRAGSARLNLRPLRLPAPTIRILLAAGLVIGVLTATAAQFFPIAKQFDLFGIFSLLFAFWPQYILLFVAGILVYRTRNTPEGNWLERIPAQSLRFWGWLSAGLVIFLPPFFMLGGAADGSIDLFMSGLNWRCILFSLWIGLATIAFSLTLVLWMRGRVKPGSRLAAFAGPNTYVVYLIHPLILVPVTHALSFLDLPAMVNFIIASVVTVTACFLIAEGVRRIFK